MIKSAFLRRILTLLLISVILSALLTAAIFSPTSRSMFANSRAKELIPRAESIAYSYMELLQGNLSEALFRAYTRSNATWDAQINIFNYLGELAYYSADANALQADQAAIEEQAAQFADQIGSYVTTVLACAEGVTVLDSKHFEVTHLIVGVPVVIDGITSGAVFLTKSLDELDATINSLNVSLILIMTVVFLLLLIPAYLASRMLVRPINQMRDVALAMAGGDFSVRANASQTGEIGQLGHSLNYLSERLSQTISALVVERKRMEQIINGLSEGIIAIDRQGRITHINPAIRALFHYEAETCADPLSLLPDASFWSDFSSVITEGVAVMRSMKMGNIILRVNITPLEDDDGKCAGAVALLRDITESERLEQTRKEYVANVSHELRTPVSAIRGFAEALSDGMVQSENDRIRYYSYILRESMRLSRLINDLLELSRLQSGAVAFEQGKVDVRDLLLMTADCYHGKADELGIHLIGQVADDCPFALSNADRIEQVLVILLDNALKFTPEGGSITLSAGWDEQVITLTVADTGSGINPDDLPHVFDRFYKADKAHTGSGTGLGLSIAREIITLMGGRIWVNSTQSEGTQFHFTVARAPREA